MKKQMIIMKYIIDKIEKVKEENNWTYVHSFRITQKVNESKEAYLERVKIEYEHCLDQILSFNSELTELTTELMTACEEADDDQE